MSPGNRWHGEARLPNGRRPGSGRAVVQPHSGLASPTGSRTIWELPARQQCHLRTTVTDLALRAVRLRERHKSPVPGPSHVFVWRLAVLPDAAAPRLVLLAKADGLPMAR